MVSKAGLDAVEEKSLAPSGNERRNIKGRRLLRRNTRLVLGLRCKEVALCRGNCNIVFPYSDLITEVCTSSFCNEPRQESQRTEFPHKNVACIEVNLSRFPLRFHDMYPSVFSAFYTGTAITVSGLIIVLKAMWSKEDCSPDL
jgi:hypothetical protein